MTNYKRMFISVIAMLAIIIAGCGKQLQKTTLFPETLTTGDGDDDYNDDIYCIDLVDHGTCHTVECYFNNSVPDNTVLVGYDNSYWPGTQPLACWQWVDSRWRGYIKFIGPWPGKNIVAATLKWKITTKGNMQNCARKLFIANEPWDKKKYAISGEEIGVITIDGKNVLDKGEINIGLIVSDWVTGKRPNHGLFFVGPNEKLEAKTNKQCTSELSNFSLEVLYVEPEWPK